MINLWIWSICSYLHTRTLHSIHHSDHAIHTGSRSGSGFSRKLKSGSENCSRAPDPCQSLVHMQCSRGVRSLIFSTPTPLLCFKTWLLLLVWLLSTEKLSTPAPI